MNIAEILTKNNQTHILDALNRLSGAEHDKLLKQIEAIDWDHLSTLIQDYVMHKPVTEIPADLAPLREPRNGLVHDGVKDARGNVGALRALIDERLDVRFREHAAA